MISNDMTSVFLNRGARFPGLAMVLVFVVIPYYLSNKTVLVPEAMENSSSYNHLIL